MMCQNFVGVVAALATTVLVSACGTANPNVSLSPSASVSLTESPVSYKDFYDGMVTARTLSEAGWKAYTTEQDKCLPLRHRRGNLASFTTCYPTYTATFRRVVALNQDYVTYLATVDAPGQVEPEFAAYREAVAAAATRLRAMFEVFCTEVPHSEVEWYNCVGSSDVSEYWERYSQLGIVVDSAADDLSTALIELGLPPFTSS